MQFAAAIQEAAALITEAGAVYRFRARQTTGEFDGLRAYWTDARSRHFSQRFLEPQRDAIEEGERLCHGFSELSSTAKSNAQEAENEIAAFFALAEEFESMAAELRLVADTSQGLCKLVSGQTLSLLSEIASCDSGVAAAAQD